MEGEPGTHGESGPVNGSGTTDQRGAGDQAQGSGLQGRSHQPANGKSCSVITGISAVITVAQHCSLTVFSLVVLKGDLHTSENVISGHK